MSSNGQPLRVVVDTNVFISSMLRRNTPPFHVVRMWVEHRFEIVWSQKQVDEILDVATRPQIERRLTLTAEEIAHILRTVRLAPTIQVPDRVRDIDVRDPSDMPILAAAIAGDADYLVTGDDDLLILRGDPRIGRLQIVTPREFLETIADLDVE